MLKILAYCGAVVIGGALLAPPLYWLGRWAVDSGTLPQIDKFGFPKYLNRAVLLVALGLLWPFLRSLGLRNVAELQIEPNPRRFGDLATGALLGVLGLALVGTLLVVVDQAQVRQRFPWDKVGGALATAATVALIEEAFFRGVLFGILRRHLAWPKALVFLSAFFAALHFIKPEAAAVKAAQSAPVDWLSGLRLLPHSFWQFAEPQLLIGGWVTLFLVGWVLGYTVVKTRSLYMAIGLHGGWVFALRSYDSIARRTAPPSIWAGEELTTGILPAGLVMLTLVLLTYLLAARGRPVAPNA